MTTQHTHHDPGDVDASVVEHSSTPEETVGPSVSETVLSAEAVVDASIPPVELASLAFEQMLAVSAQEPLLQASSSQENQAHDREEIPTPDPTPAVENEPAAQLIEENITPSRPDAIPVVGTKEEEVRPFTDFIEEFRQAEAARLQATMRESQIEAFSLLPPSEGVLTPFTQETKPATGTARAFPFAEETAQAKVVSPASIADTASSAEQASSDVAAIPQVPSSHKETVEPASTTPVVERAVSPLLRPPSRLRSSRHSSARHYRTEEKEAPATPVQAVQPEPVVQAPVETPPAAEPEPPRPARRYRFDRPATTNGNASTTTPVTPVQQRTEESRVPSLSLTRTENVSATGEPAAETKPVASSAQSSEAQTQKSSAAQEPQATESTTTSVATPPEHGRRRPSQKVQPIVASTPPVVEVPPVIVEPSTQTEEVAPEDLPPLEYAELQKVNSRRRRRHRSSSSNGTAATVAPPATVAPASLAQPVSQQAQPAQLAQPTTPPAPTPAAKPPVVAPVANPYTIVSGYTVNQMNQGSDSSGPFMGPDPSPARGSVFMRDNRTTSRAEAQRTSHTYPARPSEGGLSTSAVTQFANIVSQALQAQTDRMVAELRRVGQAPTNVSVSLPPFPSTERVGVFVDVANLLYSARTLRITVDFGKLLDFLRGNRRLVRAHAYCPTSPQVNDEQMFLQAVKGLGYRITTKNYKTFSSGAKKADLDLDLCMDVVRLVDGNAVDCVVLVSGDSDFMPMLDYCSDHGVRVEVAAFDEAMSATLRQSCDLFINLSMLEEIQQ